MVDSFANANAMFSTPTRSVHSFGHPSCGGPRLSSEPMEASSLQSPRDFSAAAGLHARNVLRRSHTISHLKTDIYGENFGEICPF